MPRYLAHKGPEGDFLGVPFPSAGVRVVFDIERLFAARDRLTGSEADRTITGDEGLVVYEDPMAVLTLPNRLWRVDDVRGEVRLPPGNRWVRCQALTVREELPTWLVMGSHGDAVAHLISQTRNLTDRQAREIAALDPAEEKRRVDLVWDLWLSTGRSGSPVGCGLHEVSGAVVQSARRVGRQLFGWDDQDGIEVLIDPAWLQASHAANAAALALGAPDILGDEESRWMARRWTTVVGPR